MRKTKPSTKVAAVAHMTPEISTQSLQVLYQCAAQTPVVNGQQGKRPTTGRVAVPPTVVAPAPKPPDDVTGVTG